jgi:hypothetical protein
MEFQPNFLILCKKTLKTFWDSQLERWWYKLTHVSRRWRRLILAAPSLLDLHLVCTSGVPVSDMLAHSPTLPLTICYRRDPLNGYSMTAEDVDGALLALSHRDRVYRIALYMPSSELEKLFVAIDGQFPILERLNILSLDTGPGATLPRTFGAPNLSHVKLMRVALPTQCRLLLTTTGLRLVSLRLRDVPRSGYFPPSYILTSLSLMPQLETLWIVFNYPVPSRYVQDTSMSHVILPNLREFRFRGVRAYLEGLCARMTAPVLSVVRVTFFNQLSFAVPHLSSFMQTSGNLQFNAAELVCNKDIVYLSVLADSQLSTWKYHLDLQIWCRYLEWQISSAIQILDALSRVLSAVEQVTIIVNGDESSHDEVNRTQWRGIFRSFSNVRKLHVETKLVMGDACQGLGHSLCTEDGEQPLELLPNLEEVICSGKDDEYAFTPFINEREAVGRSVRLTLQSR